MVVGCIEKAVTQELETELAGEPGIAEREGQEGCLPIDQDYVEGAVESFQVFGQRQTRPATADDHHARAGGRGQIGTP